MTKKFLSILIITSCLLVACSNNSANKKKHQLETKIQFTDDAGSLVRMNQPATRIISLYPAHTENLFCLGLNQEIIGVSKNDVYPIEVKNKPVFDFRSDPEKIIAADPDLVLIRPFVKRISPEFVKSLENAGINVVSLFPSHFKQFESYIKKLAQLSGKETKADQLLSQFNQAISEVEKKVQSMKPRVRVFFESNRNNYRTVTKRSIAAHAIKTAGGVNIAEDAQELRKGSSIAAYGAERLLEKAEDVDVYIAQKGIMNPVISVNVIYQRPGFAVISAVRNKRVYIISEKLVSSPTFRFAEGVKKLACFFYPEIQSNLLSNIGNR